jgi:imidazole glycerol-phosphate synthase subunit HisF
MLTSRVIPCLLVHERRLVKTVRFKDPAYIGDPVNAVKIFNEKEVDELIMLDISATPAGRGPAFELAEEIAGECFMPLTWGGGVRSVDDVGALLRLGVEKVVINTAALLDPGMVRKAADRFGNQCLVAALDVKRRTGGNYEVHIAHATRGTGKEPAKVAKQMEEAGAGEILVNSIDRDGTQAGYDLDLVKQVSSAVGLPVIACGGAGSIDDLARVVREGGAMAAAAGSIFVFHGKQRAVLISYPHQDDIRRVLP